VSTGGVAASIGGRQAPTLRGPEYSPFRTASPSMTAPFPTQELFYLRSNSARLTRPGLFDVTFLIDKPLTIYYNYNVKLTEEKILSLLKIAHQHTTLF
jgi:hypothetical protein